MKSASGISPKLKRFLGNPRATVSLFLLFAIFFFSLIGNFFTPSPSEIVAPDSLADYRRIRVRLLPEVRVGRIDLKPGFAIASSTGCEAILPEAVAGSSMADAVALPPGFEEAVTARFGNVAAPAFSADAGKVELSLLAFTPRPNPPKTVRLRIREAGTAAVKPLSFMVDPARLATDSRAGQIPHCMPLPAQARSMAEALDADSFIVLTNAIASQSSRNGSESPTSRLKFKDGSSATLEVSLENVTWPFRPVPGHPMGIDAAGRDVFARVVAGTRIALLFGFVLVVSSMVLGIAAGAIQGYCGGVVDIATQRFIEIWSSLPFLYVMILVGSVFGRGFVPLLVCYGLFNWVGISYYMRAEFLRLRSRPFVEAARCQGLSSWCIISKHILPNALTPVITLAPFNLIGAISSISALDFLGFGLPPLTPSLGELLGQAQQNTSAWWLTLYPSLMLFTTMLLSVFIGEGLRDAFDPKPEARYR